MRSVVSSRGVVARGVVPAESELDEADLPADRVSDAKRLVSEEGVRLPDEPALSGVLRPGAQEALRLNGGVTGSDVPDDVDESVDGAILNVCGTDRCRGVRLLDASRDRSGCGR